MLASFRSASSYCGAEGCGAWVATEIGFGEEDQVAGVGGGAFYCCFESGEGSGGSGEGVGLGDCEAEVLWHGEGCEELGERVGSHGGLGYVCFDFAAFGSTTQSLIKRSRSQEW